MSTNKNVIIFKNDAVGDLVQSLDAIHNIINNYKKYKILIYLSERSKNFDFFFNFKNVEIKILNYNLSFIEKIKIIYKLVKSNTEVIYILTPKNFYFYLPIFFKNIKFYALCINSTFDYKRPSVFLRKYLYKYVINERDKIVKRKSTMQIQRELTQQGKIDFRYKITYLPSFKYYNLHNIDDYIYFHLKISNFKKLGWGICELRMMFDEFLKYKKNIIFTKDLEPHESKIDYKKFFNVINFISKKKILNNSNIYL